MFLPAKLSINKSAQDWIKLIFNEFEKSQNQLGSLNQTVFIYFSNLFNSIIK